MTEGMVRVPLTVERTVEKAQEMARLVKAVEGIKAEAKEEAAKYREEVERLMGELTALANAVQEGAEERNQMELTFTEVEAAKALAQIGTVAGETPEAGAEVEVESPTPPTPEPPKKRRPTKSKRRHREASA